MGGVRDMERYDDAALGGLIQIETACHIQMHVRAESIFWQRVEYNVIAMDDRALLYVNLAPLTGSLVVGP